MGLQSKIIWFFPDLFHLLLNSLIFPEILQHFSNNTISCTKLLETASQAADGGEMGIAPYSNSSYGNPTIQHANGALPHDLWHLWHYDVWQILTFWGGLL